MKRQNYRNRFLLMIGVVFLWQAGASAEERWINAAYVKNGSVDTGNPAAKLAVRSGPGMNFKQVDALSSGQKVVSLEARAGWVRIAPNGASVPQSSAAGRWINAAYVKNGAVDVGSSGAQLAVRSGPGMGYGVVDKISSGQKVVSLESRNGWVRIPESAPVASAPVRAPVPVTVAATPAPRPVPAPVRPPVSNLILNGDFSAASLALPTAAGNTTAELSGRWIRSVTSAWEISPYGGNLGGYVRAAASRTASRLLYVASDAKRSAGSYLLRFDYILTDPADALAVRVFVSDRDITVGTDGGVLKMNDTKSLPDMIALPASAGWTAYSLPVELGSGYNCIYVLFTGSGAGNTGIDNVSLTPKRR
jgi:uncharacterized protein YraI